ncbi:FxSxx-COOH system tetratricopeptide repeat protein [Streptomyces sp. ITFR-6]|uniref:FxSxx-COOH system tetratricopeptide repeat protein n=1 Tax=Streptomyces sp. ITFR-6 TaxID=3075197 RepID=UPI00288A533F|nr:FxSxx-COOH system tetratricopeptide repeat protein [Streptomyces sp. ITFR-6]WNI29273.1 FxSxx-COOH system tetratricopeptide repeat protein [Streptomyces sp. ITFR-6]
MNGDERPLLIEPVVGWLSEVGPGVVQCVGVDLRGPLNARNEEDGEAWPYEEEELAFSVSLDGAPHFVCEVLDDPGLVLHRFGGTYGPARFLVTAGTATGPGVLRLTISNQWGAPVRRAELPCLIREPAEPDEDLSRPAGHWLPGSAGPAGSGQAAPAAGPRPTPTASRPGTAAPPAPSHPAPSGAAGAITLSYADSDRAWAAWTADRLERRGVTVHRHRPDPRAGDSPADTLRALARTGGRILLLLSPRYVRLADHGREEWDRALREVVGPERERFAAIWFTHTAPLRGAVSLLDPLELYGVGADDAERRLLVRLGLPTGPLPEDVAARSAPHHPAHTPEVWGGVPRRNTRFTGREELLAGIGEAFHTGAPAGAAVTLSGMPGVGKTQLAAEYVHRFGFEYDVVWWVPADRRAPTRQKLAELAPGLGLSTGPEYGERLRAVHESLRRGEPYARWLVVLDGADEPDQIRDLVPAGTGHVLITSRNAGQEGRDAPVEVPAYRREESVAFIRLRAPRLNHAEADRLAEALEDLPLLLDQTAGWLTDSGLPVEEYLGLLEHPRQHDVVKVSADYPLAFHTGWSVQLTELGESAPESYELLRLCAFFAPGSIPVRLLDGAALPGPLTDDARRARAVRHLVDRSAVRLEADPDPLAAADGEALQIHRMVHQFVRGGIAGSDRPVYREAARRALAAADPGDPADIRHWPAYAALTPHLKWAEVLESEEPPVQRLVLNCLRYMYLSGEYGSGVRFAAPAMESWQALLGPAHPRIRDLRHHYANLLRALGDYTRSEAVERTTAEFLAAERGELDPDHLRAAGGLAADLRGLGRYREALYLSVSIRDRYRRLLGHDDPRTLNAENNVAVSLRLLGRYRQALEADEFTLERRRAVLPERAPATLYSEINLATDLRLLGRHREAETALRRTAGRHLRWMGGNNPQTLRAQYHLALCQYALEGAASALPALAATRDSSLRLLGEHDPLTLLISTAAAGAEREAGDPGRALRLHEQVVDGYRRMLGDRHPYTVGAEGNLGLMHWAMGDREQGYDEIERAGTRMSWAVGENHPWTIGCALNTVLMRARTGRPGAAVELGRANCERANAELGSRHPLSVGCYAAIATEPTDGEPDFWPFEPLIV